MGSTIEIPKRNKTLLVGKPSLFAVMKRVSQQHYNIRLISCVMNGTKLRAH